MCKTKQKALSQSWLDRTFQWPIVCPVFQFRSHSQRNKVKLSHPHVPSTPVGTPAPEHAAAVALCHTMAHRNTKTCLCVDIFSHSSLPAEELRHCVLLVLRLEGGKVPQPPELSYHWLIERQQQVAGKLASVQIMQHVTLLLSVRKSNEETQPQVCSSSDDLQLFVPH